VEAVHAPKVRVERGYALHADGQMSFAVERALGHDDFLVSLALAVEAAGYALPRRATIRVGSRELKE
jgi:hypothetical protein